jgi:hypothetical protein
VTVFYALQPHDQANRIEGHTLQNKPHTEDELKENIQREILEVPWEELLWMNSNLYREGVCVQVQHFQHLL